MKIRVLDSLSEIPAADWGGLAGRGNPFTSYPYLAALEESGAVGEEAGWLPRHVALEDEEGRLAAALPLYLKDNSWGEFVFDFAWAEAYERAGLPYYPKLVAAVPFTPVRGPRVLVDPRHDPDDCSARLLEAARELAAKERASSLHVLLAS